MVAKGEMGGRMGEIKGNKYFLKSEKKNRKQFDTLQYGIYYYFSDAQVMFTIKKKRRI